MHAFKLNGLQRGFFSAMLALMLSLFALAAESKDANNGLLWKIEAPNGKTSYLFGTIHSDDPRVSEFSPALQQAMKDSEAFMMEVLPAGDPSLFLMQGRNLRDFLTDKEIDQVFELADLHAMHHDAALTMKPWLLATVFDLPKPQALGTQDEQLFAVAQSQSKQLLGLEDAAEHFAALDSFSLEEQVTMLRAVLKRTQQEKQRDYDALLNAYLSGDTSKINKLDEQITGGLLTKELWDRMKVKLLDERNIIMAQRIAQEANEGPVFVAVGASHLPGDGGLLARLRVAGYKISSLR